MVKISECWIIRNHKSRFCDQNGYTHIVLTLYTYPTRESRIKIVEISNLFSDIMYHYKTSKFGPIMEETSKSFSLYSTQVLVPSWQGSRRSCAWWMTSPLGTPRGRYDVCSSKFSLSYETKVYRSGEERRRRLKVFVEPAHTHKQVLCSQLAMRLWYVSNVSIIFDAPCLFLHHLPIVSLHLVAFLCIFRN
jgi:hypothetical protein